MRPDSVESGKAFKAFDVEEQHLKHEKSRRMFERYQTIRLYLLGHDYSQIATSIGTSECTVKEYVRTYRKHGLDGLIMKFSTGVPERLTTKEQQSQLKHTIIDSSPYKSAFPLSLTGHWRLSHRTSSLLPKLLQLKKQ